MTPRKTLGPIAAAALLLFGFWGWPTPSETTSPATEEILLVASAAETEEAPPRFREVAHLITAPVFDQMSTSHQRMLVNLARAKARGERVPALCLHGNVSDAARLAFEALVYGDPNLDFQVGNRWTSTATNPSVPSVGAPITLTYSFVPDGTFIAGGAGEPAGPSDMLARFDATFGSRAAWQGLFAQVFTRWGQLSGINYVFEPNDDGAQIGTVPGVLGVRGDVRIGGHPIDGSSGILAYNNFPTNGDMVLDTNDMGNFGSTNNNFRFLRNTISHEHGHGIGIFHVCPRTNTKLMEPFISTAFDGPQLDDTISAQRLYGDPFEPNDNAAQSTDLGSLNLGLTPVRDVSCDATGDPDWYRFTVPADRQLTVTLRPRGATYLEGPQTSACNTGTSINTAAFNDLSVQILAQNGATVLANGNFNPAGVNEVITNFFLPEGAGTYFIRVLPGPVNQPQLYELDLTLSVAVPPAFTIEFPNGVPATVAPDQSFDIGVFFAPGTGTVDPVSAVLRVQPAGGALQFVPLLPFGNNFFIARLPALACNGSATWWVEARPFGSFIPVTSPNGAPTNRYTTRSTGVTLFTDDFNGNLGWTVTNGVGLTDGAWERGIPVGNGSRGDPTTAFGGSGSAYLTANRTGNSDVDGGETTLTSPPLSVLLANEPAIEVAIWYSNDTGNNPNQDSMAIEISGDNGLNWVLVENYSANTGVWTERRYRILDFLPTLTAQVRMRFTASDFGAGSVVEAGVDAFRLVSCGATGTGPALTEPCASGTAVRDLLAIDWSTGNEARRVEQVRVFPVNFHVQSPTAAPAALLLFAKIGVPTPAEVFPLGAGLGELCFPPCFLSPDPTLLTLVDGLGGLACSAPLFPGSTAPWTFELPAPFFALDLTVQGVLLPLSGVPVVTNAVLLRIL